MPTRVNPFEAGTLAGRDLPCLIALADAVAHNIAAMADYCSDHGVDLAPHAKTSMSAWVTRQQLKHGAWAMTVATPRQARDMSALGVPRVLLANILVSPTFLRWVSETFLCADPRSDFACYVDSDHGVGLLESTLRQLAPARPLSVLIEVG